MNNIQVVVSRFNENLYWLNQLPTTIQVIVYNKGEPIEVELRNNIKIMDLPNMGRDCHTIFFHIYENYDKLVDFTIFLQGNPFEHSPNVLEILNNSKYNKHFEYLCDWLPETCLDDCPYHSGLPMRDTYNRVFQCNETENKNFTFGAGAQFMVSKQRILQRPRDFYKNIVDLLDYHIKPIEGWVIERLIGEIFMQSSDNYIELYNKIPIVIVCYNNHKYVENTIRQLYITNPTLMDTIIIMNNSSDHPETIEYLKNISPYTKIRTVENKGPWITPYDNVEFFNELPEQFILTDPDLEFHSELPSNFVDILSQLSEQYQTSKIGFAIRIDDFDKMYPSEYIQNICIWESKFWQHRVPTDEYILYHSDIDTTFALINKKYWTNISLRIAGNFTCRHLPFYLDNGVISIKEEFEYYTSSKFSSLNNVFLSYFMANYTIENGIITKNQTYRVI
jgi:hypothetical protein